MFANSLSTVTSGSCSIAYISLNLRHHVFEPAPSCESLVCSLSNSRQLGRLVWHLSLCNGAGQDVIMHCHVELGHAWATHVENMTSMQRMMKRQKLTLTTLSDIQCKDKSEVLYLPENCTTRPYGPEHYGIGHFVDSPCRQYGYRYRPRLVKIRSL